MKKSGNYLPTKDYMKVLVYCSTLEDLELSRTHLPLIDEYWDAFTDIDEAKKAIETGEYGIIIADYTTHNPRGRDLLLSTNSISSNIQQVCISCRKRRDVVSRIWDNAEGYFFKFKGEERDAMTSVVYSMFTEHSTIRWIHHMQGEFNRMRNRIQKENTQTILLVGEPGTGKFTLSQIAHMRSDRRNKNFIFANCQPLKRQVNIWGHTEKSHFLRILRSMAKEAEGGTLYFHEIDALDVEAQDLVAQFLSKELKVNTDKSKFNGVVISSSTRNMEALASSHICSEDLIKILRRNVMKVPSLLEYRDDLESLILDMLESYCVSQDIPTKTITKEALGCMVDHVWSRNIREVFDVIKHAVSITPNKRISVDAIVMKHYVDKIDTNTDKTRKVKQALRESKGVKVRAAQILEIAPKTLYAWMKELGIPLEYK